MRRLLIGLFALALATPCAAQELRKQSDSTYPLEFLMLDSGDHITGKTGLSPTVTLSKNGGSFASPSGAVTEIANGWYKVAGNATDTNTVGPLVLHASSSGADPTDRAFAVVPWNPFDAVRLGLTALPNAAAEASGGLITRGTSTGQLAVTAGAVTTGTNSDKTGYTLSQSFPSNFSSLSIDSNGRVKAQVNYIKGVALAKYTFLMTDSTDHNPLTGLVNGDFTKKTKIDAGAVGNLSGSISEVDSTAMPGVYSIDLSSGETNGTVITLVFKTSTSDETVVTIVTSQ